MHRLIHRYMPTRERLLATRMLRPFAHRLAHPALWHLNRWSVSRGVALGFFFGLLLPFGQTLVAALVALNIRANVLVTAAATFITNPITNAPIFYAAYRTGLVILPAAPNLSEGQDNAALYAALWAVDVSAPTAVGLALFAAVGGTLGYFGAQLGWRLWIGRRWRERRTARRDDLSVA